MGYEKAFGFQSFLKFEIIKMTIDLQNEICSTDFNFSLFQD